MSAHIRCLLALLAVVSASKSATTACVACSCASNSGGYGGTYTNCGTGFSTYGPFTCSQDSSGSLIFRAHGTCPAPTPKPSSSATSAASRHGEAKTKALLDEEMLTESRRKKGHIFVGFLCLSLLASFWLLANRGSAGATPGKRANAVVSPAPAPPKAREKRATAVTVDTKRSNHTGWMCCWLLPLVLAIVTCILYLDADSVWSRVFSTTAATVTVVFWVLAGCSNMCSEQSVFLMNLKPWSDASHEMKRMCNAAPLITFKVECYHMVRVETKITVTVAGFPMETTDVSHVKKVTFKETSQPVKFGGWVDKSSTIDHLVGRFKVIKIYFENKFECGDVATLNFLKGKGQQFKMKHQGRDVCCKLTGPFLRLDNIGEHENRIAAYSETVRGIGCLPMFLSSWLGFAWPYHMYFESVSVRAHLSIKKIVFKNQRNVPKEHAEIQVIDMNASPVDTSESSPCPRPNWDGLVDGLASACELGEQAKAELHAVMSAVQGAEMTPAELQSIVPVLLKGKRVSVVGTEAASNIQKLFSALDVDDDGAVSYQELICGSEIIAQYLGHAVAAKQKAFDEFYAKSFKPSSSMVTTIVVKDLAGSAIPVELPKNDTTNVLNLKIGLRKAGSAVPIPEQKLLLKDSSQELEDAALLHSLDVTTVFVVKKVDVPAYESEDEWIKARFYEAINTNLDGQTPAAVTEQKEYEIDRLLLEQGADANKAKSNGVTPADLEWIYKDADGTQYGPFPNSDMRTWFTGAHLDDPDWVYKPNSSAGDFRPLKDLFPILKDAFLAMPLYIAAKERMADCGNPAHADYDELAETVDDLMDQLKQMKEENEDLREQIESGAGRSGGDDRMENDLHVDANKAKRMADCGNPAHADYDELAETVDDLMDQMERMREENEDLQEQLEQMKE